MLYASVFFIRAFRFRADKFGAVKTEKNRFAR